MGTIYKIRYYLIQFTEDINLFETLELLVINYPILKMYGLVSQIKIVDFDSHFGSFEVDSNRSTVNNCLIFEPEEFRGSPINITPTSLGGLMICLQKKNLIFMFTILRILLLLPFIV